MSQDLRSYIDRIKKDQPDDFLTISREIDPAFEITAMTVKLEQEAKRRPIIFFEKVKGTPFPVLTNLHAGRWRLATAIHSTPEKMQRAYLHAMEKPIPPKIVATAPVKEIIRAGEQVDLYQLPQILHHEEDAGPYITAAISFAKAPHGGTWNCAYNRLMIKSRNTTSIHLTLGKHLWEFQRNAEAQGRTLPVAFAIGVHPAIALGCLAIGSIDEDERAIMGGLLGEPLELVKCETSDVLVPAHAEMIIEGEIVPHERTAEGPFGEFTGYSLGERQREVLKVRAVTHRRDAIFQDISVGHLDHLMLSTTPIEANLYRAVRAMVPSVKAVRIPAPFTVYVSIEKKTEGQGKNAILAVLGTDLYMKHVIVVDHDIDIFNDQRVQWAVGTRCQADRDVMIVSNVGGSDLDPSDLRDGVTAKMGIDATAKPLLGSFTPRHRVPKDVWERLDLTDFLPSSWLAQKDGKR
jgi:UbiD family decarboxylase